MASTDLKTAASSIPGTQIPPTSLVQNVETVIYTCPTGAAFIGKVYLTNVTGGAATALVSLVKSGGSSVAGNRIIARPLAAGETALLTVQLNDGDALWGQSGSATAISVVVDGTVFSNSTGGGLTGIQVDADGTPGRGASGSASGCSVKIGTNANRWLLGGLMLQPAGATAGWSTYTTLSMSCTDGAMTRLASIDFNNGSGLVGSTHIFGRANPTSGSTQALTAAAAVSGGTVGLVMGARAYSGVGSITGAVTTGPTGAAAMSLGITSATGHVPFFVGSFFAPPIALGATGLRIRQFDGLTSGFTVPQWLLIADAIGIPTFTATTSNSTQHAAAAVDLVPA